MLSKRRQSRWSISFNLKSLLGIWARVSAEHIDRADFQRVNQSDRSHYLKWTHQNSSRRQLYRGVGKLHHRWITSYTPFNYLLSKVFCKKSQTCKTKTSRWKRFIQNYAKISTLWGIWAKNWYKDFIHLLFPNFGKLESFQNYFPIFRKKIFLQFIGQNFFQIEIEIRNFLIFQSLEKADEWNLYLQNPSFISANSMAKFC